MRVANVEDHPSDGGHFLSEDSALEPLGHQLRHVSSCRVRVKQGWSPSPLRHVSSSAEHVTAELEATSCLDQAHSQLVRVVANARHVSPLACHDDGPAMIARRDSSGVWTIGTDYRRRLVPETIGGIGDYRYPS